MKSAWTSEINNVLKEFFGKDTEPKDVTTLTGDASGRQYFRAHLKEVEAPRTVIVMDFRNNLSPSDVALNTEVPEELPFVNMTNHLARVGVPVPRIYLDASQKGMLLLEDLGDVVFADVVLSKRSSLEMVGWYEAAVDLLVSLHKSMWPMDPACVASTRAFDYELLRWELDHYREWGAEVPGERQLDEKTRAALDSAFDDLATEILEMKRGFVHRDYQSRNLMVKGEAPAQDNLTIIDYQDARIGPRVYDLVALLNDSYVDLEKEIKEMMIQRYAEKSGIGYEELAVEFHLVTIHRKLKDGARFVFFDREKGNSSYLPYVEGSYDRVKESLDALKEHTPLKEALEAADPKHFAV